MPRIPDVADLPRARLRNLPDVNVDTGVERVGRALSGFVDAFGEFGRKIAERDEREAEARQRLDLTHRAVKAADELDGFVRRLEDDPEYASYVERFDAKAGEVRDGHKDGLAPEFAGLFDRKLRDLTAAQGLAVRNLRTRKLVDGAGTALDDIVDTYGRLAARAPNEAAGTYLTDQAFKAIGELADAGLIGEDERVKRGSRFLSSLVGAQLDGLLRLDPDLAQSVLDDPAELSGLDEADRERLLARTRPRIEAARRDREIAGRRADAEAVQAREEKARAFEADRRARLEAGAATHDEIEIARADGVLSEGRAKALRAELDRDAERRGRNRALLSRIGEAIDAGRRLDPANADDVAAVDLMFRERHRPALIQAVRDPNRLARLLPAISRDFDRIGMVPEGLAELADAWWTSGDPRFQAGAARLIDLVYRPGHSGANEDGPQPLGPAVPDELRRQAQLAVRLMHAGVPDEVAVKRAGAFAGASGNRANAGFDIAGLDDAIGDVPQGLGTDETPFAIGGGKGLPDFIAAGIAAALRRLFELAKRTRPVPEPPQVDPVPQPPPTEPDRGPAPAPATPEILPKEPKAPEVAHPEEESSAPSESQPKTAGPARYPSARDLHGLPENDTEYFVTIQNRRFLRGREGTADIGRAGLTEDAELGVRIARRDLPHVDTPMRSAEAHDAGYRNGIELTVDVAGNWQEVRKSDGERIILVKRNGANKVAVVELDRFAGEDFYRVVTSGMRKDDQIEPLPLIRVRKVAP